MSTSLATSATDVAVRPTGTAFPVAGDFCLAAAAAPWFMAAANSLAAAVSLAAFGDICGKQALEKKGRQYGG